MGRERPDMTRMKVRDSLAGCLSLQQQLQAACTIKQPTVCTVPCGRH